MIDNRELRIGNLVTLSGSLILTVYEIHEDCFYAKDAKGSSFKNTWADLQPIPLSEEVLLKSGFIKYQWQDAFYKKIPYGCSLYIHFFKDEILVSLSVVSKDGKNEDKKKHIKIGNKDYFKNIKYLHQLQNIYYALTGEELEVSL